MRKLRIAFAVLAALSAISLALHYTVFPFGQSVALSDLTVEPDGLLSTELAPPWPLKVNKRGLADMTVTLPDGTDMPQFGSRIALLRDETERGFYINRPRVFIKLPSSAASEPDAEIGLGLPVKLRELFHKVLLSLALVLGLWIWLRRGLLALVSGRAKPMAWLSLGSLAAAGAGFWLAVAMQGIALWLGLGLLLGGVLGAVASVLSAGETEGERHSRRRERMAGALLAIASSFLCLAVAEAYLSIATSTANEQTAATPTQDVGGQKDWFQLPQSVVSTAMSRSKALTLPKEWERRPVEVADARNAFYWHGALHIHDVNGFRRLNQPFAEKESGKLRVMVVGDSLTYGYGIPEEWTYSRLLEKALQESQEAEVINLGRSGYQSTDIRNVMKTFAPKVAPDLIVYAVCLNDFLPSGQGEYAGGSFPLPDAWKNYFLDRTKLAKLLSDSYHSLLLALDIKQDFYDDILSQDTAYKERFAADVKAMNRFAMENGLPPVVGIVFHQFFGVDERAWLLIDEAEASLAAAGFDLISIKPWRQELDGKDFPVSRWEGHPNELAHSLIAEALYERLLERGYAEGYEGGIPDSAAEQGESTD